MMTSNQPQPAIPVINERGPQRPKSLLQRLSSGVVHALPSLRISSSRTELMDRATTPSGLARRRASGRLLIAESEQLLVLDAGVIAPTDPVRPCPYDPNSYQLFASIGKRRCSFCGMRGPKLTFSEPCYACKTGGPRSHTTLVDAQRRHSAIDTCHLAHVAHSSDSVILAPRPVTPERAAKRIGNPPPRVSKLPPGIIRLSPANALNADQHLDLIARPPSRLGTRTPEDSHGSPSHGSPKTPSSPKLHHLHGFSSAVKLPFVHRHEIPKHAIALRAGSTSPLTDRSNSPRSSLSTRGPTDHSNTVYYGRRQSPLPSSRTSMQRPQVTTVVVEQVHASDSAVIDHHASPLNTTLAEREVYRGRWPKLTPTTPSQALIDITDSSTTFGSQDTGSTKIGNMRLELKGGIPSTVGIPRLRGGSGHDKGLTNTLSYKLKRWILLCHGPCPESDDNSDDDLPPARVVTPDRVAKMRQKMSGTAPLPVHLCKGAPSTASSSFVPHANSTGEGTSPATIITTIISGPPKRPLCRRLSSALYFPSRLPRLHESPINQPPLLTPSQILTPTIPHLRGGADSQSRIPSTLFWLAGGTGRNPISSSGWKQSLSKQRMSGLFGMAVFGDRYGQKYRVKASMVGDAYIECLTSVKVVVENAVSVTNSKGAGVASSSSSGSSSIESSRVVPVKEIAVVPESGASDGDTEPVQRAPSLTPSGLVDNGPLCSGALPVGATADVPRDGALSVPLGEGDTRRDDTITVEEKKPHIS